MTTEYGHSVTCGPDGETVGYLEPLDHAGARALTLSALGAPSGDPSDFETGEDRLLEHRIRETASPRHKEPVGTRFIGMSIGQMHLKVRGCGQTAHIGLTV